MQWSVEGQACSSAENLNEEIFPWSPSLPGITCSPYHDLKKKSSSVDKNVLVPNTEPIYFILI